MASDGSSTRRRPRIAHFAGPNATIMNSPPLVTSNKAREQYGLPLLRHPDGTPSAFDVLRAQRLAAPVTVYVEQFSAHPLERDAAELYAPARRLPRPAGVFHRERQGPEDVPVYEVTLRPEDGLYPLPYMARQANGDPWEEDCAYPNAPAASGPSVVLSGRLARVRGDRPPGHRREGRGQPDRRPGRRRLLPAAAAGRLHEGTARGAAQRRGRGDIAPEARGRDFFPYRPVHLARLAAPARPWRAFVNCVQGALASGRYDGAMWTQGSPRVEETAYWLNLLLDTRCPCGNAAQRTHGQISGDGDKNIVDSLTTSRRGSGPTRKAATAPAW